MRVYADGEKVFEGSAFKGETQTWEADRQLYVHCGYGSAVRAIVNGRECGLLGRGADTVRVEWLLAPGTPSVASTVMPTQVILREGTSVPPVQRATETPTAASTT